MPTYSFLCESCQNEYELVQPMSADLPTVCPDCGSTEFRQLFGIGILATVNGSDNVTLGTYAERNTKRLSQEERDRLSKTEKSPDKKLPKGMTRVTPSREPQWYDKFGTATKKEIRGMSTGQKKKYILTGNK